MEIIRFWWEEEEEEEEEEYNADNPAEVEEEEEEDEVWLDLRRIAWVNALRNAILLLIIIIMCVLYEKRFL